MMPSVYQMPTIFSFQRIDFWPGQWYDYQKCVLVHFALWIRAGRFILVHFALRGGQAVVQQTLSRTFCPCAVLGKTKQIAPQSNLTNCHNATEKTN